MEWECSCCGRKEAFVHYKYIAIMCCDGKAESKCPFSCGGKPKLINPVFCDRCQERMDKKSMKKKL